MPAFDAVPAATGWFKSTRSGGSDNCVEANHLRDGHTEVRHSKDPAGMVLTFTAGMWEGLVETLAAQDFPASAEWTLARPDHRSSAQARLTEDGSVELSHSDADTGEVLTFTSTEWEMFAAGARAGEFAWRLPERHLVEAQANAEIHI